MGTFWITVAFLLIWTVLLLILAYTPVETGNIGMVFRFGKLVRILEPGFNLVIPFIDRVEHHSTQAHQHELPDEPENIDRLSDVPPPGKKHPFRVIHKGKTAAIFYIKKDESDPSVDRAAYDQKHFQDLDDAAKTSMAEDSVDAPLTSEIAAVVEWYLEGTERRSIENFVKNVSPEKGRNREEEVRKRIEDMVSRALQEFLGPVTLGHASERIPLFSRMLKERLEVLVGEKDDRVTGVKEKPWGIHIKDAYIKKVEPGRRINEARADAAAADSRKRDAIRESEGKAQATRNQAEAEKDAEIAKGKGEAGRIAAMVEVMDNPNARFIATLDVAEQVLPHAKPIIIQGGGMGEAIASVLALGQQDLTNKKTTGNPPTNP